MNRETSGAALPRTIKQGGIMETDKFGHVTFTEQPRIGNRNDALELLETLINADSVQNESYALRAIKDAIERFII